MDILTRTEININRNEQEDIDNALKVGQELYARKLMGGYGDKIRDSIGKPMTKQDKKLVKKAKRAKFWMKIKTLFLGEEKYDTTLE